MCVHACVLICVSVYVSVSACACLCMDVYVCMEFQLCTCHFVVCMFMLFPERPVVIAVRPNVTLGENVTFDCNEFGSPPFSYQWYMRDAVTGDDILLVNETEEFYNITSTVYNDTGEYFCEASNSLGVFSNSTPVQLLGK